MTTVCLLQVIEIKLYVEVIVGKLHYMSYNSIQYREGVINFCRTSLIDMRILKMND